MHLILLAGLLVIAAIIDLKTRTVPPWIWITVLLFAPLHPTWTFSSALLGMLIGGGVLLTPSLLGKPTFGGGDIKLLAALGYVLGCESTLLGLFLSVALSLIPCIYLKRCRKQNEIAFVPCIAIGFMLAMFPLL